MIDIIKNDYRVEARYTYDGTGENSFRTLEIVGYGDTEEKAKKSLQRELYKAIRHLEKTQSGITYG